MINERNSHAVKSNDFLFSSYSYCLQKWLWTLVVLSGASTFVTFKTSQQNSRQRGRVAGPLGLKPRGYRFKLLHWSLILISCLFLSRPQFSPSVMLLNSQLVWKPPIVIFRPDMFSSHLRLFRFKWHEYELARYNHHKRGFLENEHNDKISWFIGGSWVVLTSLFIWVSWVVLISCFIWGKLKSLPYLLS